MSDSNASFAAMPKTDAAHGVHEKHCFVVMPFGHDASEQKWFKGWYEVVIKPAILEAGYEPKLAAAEEQPGAINDEIRSHLARDPMVVVDLGGAEPEDDPNPNVMYELGIRHALGQPLVMMAWKGQTLPFDVSNQRIIMEERDLVDLDQNRRKLVNFILAAAEGKFYRPMEAVGRMAAIEVASESLGEDSLLRALAQEVRDLRASMIQAFMGREVKRVRELTPTVKKLIRGKVFRKDVYADFAQAGGDPSVWARILRIRLDPSEVEQMTMWDAAEWKQYVHAQAAEIMRSEAPVGFKVLDEKVLTSIRDLLPAKPWQTGIHREIADRLGLTWTQTAKYIAEILRREAPPEEAVPPTVETEKE